MKIGVLSDTHSKPLPAQLIDEFKKVDFIIHAGDFCDEMDYKACSKIKDVKAVYGNMDGPSIRNLFPRRQILECEGVKIGLYHGEGHPKTLLEKVKDEFKDDRVDAIIFGHSHQAMNEKLDDVLFFNPGSPNDKVFAPFCSYGILEVKDKKISGRIIKVKD